jgi:hypothetical protein
MEPGPPNGRAAGDARVSGRRHASPGEEAAHGEPDGAVEPAPAALSPATAPPPHKRACMRAAGEGPRLHLGGSASCAAPRAAEEPQPWRTGVTPRPPSLPIGARQPRRFSAISAVTPFGLPPAADADAGALGQLPGRSAAGQRPAPQDQQQPQPQPQPEPQPEPPQPQQQQQGPGIAARRGLGPLVIDIELLRAYGGYAGADSAFEEDSAGDTAGACADPAGPGGAPAAPGPAAAAAPAPGRLFSRTPVATPGRLAGSPAAALGMDWLGAAAALDVGGPLLQLATTPELGAAPSPRRGAAAPSPHDVRFASPRGGGAAAAPARNLLRRLAGDASPLAGRAVVAGQRRAPADVWGPGAAVRGMAVGQADALDHPQRLPAFVPVPAGMDSAAGSAGSTELQQARPTPPSDANSAQGAAWATRADRRGWLADTPPHGQSPGEGWDFGRIHDDASASQQDDDDASGGSGPRQRGRGRRGPHDAAAAAAGDQQPAPRRPHGVPASVLREVQQRRKAGGAMLGSMQRVWEVARRQA